MDLTCALDQVTRQIGIQGLKPKQLEAVESFVSGKDTFVSLPTGYGKSIIFAILPLLCDLLLGKFGWLVKSLTILGVSMLLCLLMIGITGSCDTLDFIDD